MRGNRHRCSRLRVNTNIWLTAVARTDRSSGQLQHSHEFEVVQIRDFKAVGIVSTVSVWWYSKFWLEIFELGGEKGAVWAQWTGNTKNSRLSIIGGKQGAGSCLGSRIN